MAKLNVMYQEVIAFALASTEYLLHEENAKIFENAKKELKSRTERQ